MATTTAITAPSSATNAALVIPGQVIASSSTSSEERDFLRGHGTYVERNTSTNSTSSSTTTTSAHENNNHTSQQDEERLIASVAGVVQRVNKLVSVIPFGSSHYTGHVGDLVVGRIVRVQQPSRWHVELTSTSRTAQLPLSGVHLPGGAQRVRTAQDARDMRQLFQEGDLVSAEVHTVLQDGGLMLHTRSMRYGKLQNGCLVIVAPSLIPRLPQHFVELKLSSQEEDVVLTILFGMNGYLWIQRALPTSSSSSTSGTTAVVEYQEQQQQTHATTPVDTTTRQAMARIRNAIQCLGMVHAMVTPQHVERVYQASMEANVRIGDMLRPTNVLELTASCRK